MGSGKTIKSSTHHRIYIAGRLIDYRVVSSKDARKLRVRVGPDGVEVVQPLGRNGEEVAEFLATNGRWIIDQLERAEQLRRFRRTTRREVGEILYRGVPTRVRIETTMSRAIGNAVQLRDEMIVVSRGPRARTPVSRSLEYWLRREVRRAIKMHLEAVSERIGHLPLRVYVMGQRTKWGNCSSKRNLSFNWRLIFAPDFVLRYIVTHEMVHLVIPDHSAKFWLIVQGLSRDTERARQWLVAHAHDISIDLRSVCGEL